MSDEKADKIYNDLHDKYTDRVKELTYELRGFYLKNAQLMSVQDDFVPKAYMKWCKDTQDNVPSEFPTSQAVRDYVESKLLQDLNLKFEDVFSYWDDVPLGVASIGQCHRAILRSTGEEVAVKILCPGMEKRFRSDIKTIKSFCSLAMPQHVSALEEIERAFLTEFDYVKEATYLNKVRNNVMPRYGTMITIPKAHMSLCTKDILVMEYLHGIKMVDGIKKNYSKLCELQGRTLESMEKEMKEKLSKGIWAFKSIEEDKKDKKRIKFWLWCKDWLWSYNIPKLIHNYSVTRLIFGPAKYVFTDPPIEVGNLI
jgi:aarF domain-containing kinase